MTREEFSNEFDIRVDAYKRMKDFDPQAYYDSLEFSEYEKSIALTRAEKDFVIGYYTGKNEFGFSFEEKEIIREAIDTLTKSVYPPKTDEPVGAKQLYHDNHIFTFYSIPANLLYTIFEEVKISSYISGCERSWDALVIPTTHDELWHRLNNPFRGPSKKRVLRLNAADNLVELISDYPIGSYLLRYVEEPKPIILIDLPDDLTIDGYSQGMDCELPDITHPMILDRAVAFALQSKMIGSQGSTNGKD